VNMPLTLVVPQNISADMNDDDIISRIVQSTGTTIKFIERTHSPELTDSLFTIEGKLFEPKIAAFEALVNNMLTFGLSRDRLDLKIGIPSQLVCMLIGKRGKHVERIQKMSNTSISVDDPKANFSDRIVQIEGHSDDCLAAVRQIYGKFMDRSSPDLKPPSKLTYKFIVPLYMHDDFTTTFTRRLRTEHNVDFKLKKKEVDRVEELQAWLTGSLKECKSALTSFVYKVEDNKHHSHNDPRLTMIVPKSICAKHSSTLSSQVQGISVNVVYSAREQDEIVLELKGSEKAKLEAATLLMERIATEMPSPKKNPARADHESNVMAMNVTVPDSLVARLIGRNGDKVKSINDRCGCNLSFQKPPPYELKTPQGQPARMCTFKGSPASISEGLKMLLDRIIKLEREP